MIGPNSPASTSEDKGLDAGPAKDDDPYGLKLIACPDPLERAAKWLRSVKSQGSVDVWIAIYDVSVRRSEFF
jgi:N-alpha-acetyltransferase 15/16, NatA auxiliary subunit